MERTAPIGIFDSGVGGLTVMREVCALLPGEDVVYFADNHHAPYGNKTPAKILEYAEDISDALIADGAKLIVVACNTATGIAIHHLRKHYSIPFVGMEPAIKPAAAQSKTGKIGVLATANTFEADHFKRTKNRFANHVEVLMTVGEGLVELVESGEAESSQARALLEKYLLPMEAAGIDQLVLGCTHYPFLIPTIRQVLKTNIQIHDPAPAVAKQVKRILEEYNGLNPSTQEPNRTFKASGNSKILLNLAKNILPPSTP